MAICLACVLVMLAVAVTGCVDTSGDFTGKFVRYETATSGEERVALTRVTDGSGTSEVRATTSLADLKPGDLVKLRAVGRSWDEPPSGPEVIVVARVERE